MRTGFIPKCARKTIRTLAILLISGLLLCACSSYPPGTRFVLTTGLDRDILFYIGDTECTVTEYRVYLQDMRNGYEDRFGTGIWDIDPDLDAELKETALRRVTKIKIMRILAGREGIELDSGELTKARAAADEFFEKQTAETLKLMGEPDIELIRSIFAEDMLAGKLYDYMVSDINPEISDDEARRVTVEKILLSDRRRAEEVLEELENGRTFEELMTAYNEGKNGTVTLGKGETDESTEYAIFNLALDEVSGVVGTGDGYAVYKCINTLDREETETNKARILDMRRRKVFSERFRGFENTQLRIMNEDAWNNI